MKLSKKAKLMLYTLGEYYKTANKKVRVSSLQVVIPKTDFIRLVKEAGIAEKQPRAIYKNLEILEKKKLISYKNKELMFTDKGIKKLREIEQEIEPYKKITNIMKTKKVITLTKKPQTVFIQRTFVVGKK